VSTTAPRHRRAPVAERRRPRRRRSPVGHRPPTTPVLRPWLASQALNSTRHAAALRPFTRGEFGRGAESPSEGHLRAANEHLVALRRALLQLNEPVREAARRAQARPTNHELARVLELKERAHLLVRAIELIWDFYFELFGQRQSRYAGWLLACDRIGLDCYAAAFRGIGEHKTVPAPPPFSYMRTGFSPATYRRGLRLARLGRLPNPFPLIELPYHRLVNPWTLGAVLHEVSHNLQNDLGLDRVIPQSITKRIVDAGHPPAVAAVWRRWNRETFADMSGLLLGGPAVIASLMDVVGRSRASTLHWSPRGPHPTPYLRTFLSIELLRRMGFPEQADLYRRAWTRLYPAPSEGTIPRAVLRTFGDVCPLVVDTVCFQPYRTLGDRSLAASYRFEVKDQEMIDEAAQRLAAGNDPGVIPPRFLISAARVALDRGLARPGVVAHNFYEELIRR
jgi:hypothetical protein